MENKKLNPEQQYMFDQVAATMAVEDMQLTPQCVHDLKEVITGKKTIEESIAETIRRHTHV